jgi:hypothetical protein
MEFYDFDLHPAQAIAHQFLWKHFSSDLLSVGIYHFFNDSSQKFMLLDMISMLKHVYM